MEVTPGKVFTDGVFHDATDTNFEAYINAAVFSNALWKDYSDNIKPFFHGTVPPDGATPLEGHIWIDVTNGFFNVLMYDGTRWIPFQSGFFLKNATGSTALAGEAFFAGSTDGEFVASGGSVSAFSVDAFVVARDTPNGEIAPMISRGITKVTGFDVVPGAAKVGALLRGPNATLKQFHAETLGAFIAARGKVISISENLVYLSGGILT